ncbi:MAG TPA: DUF1302 family protein [Holophagaceae bacterium]|nr:DUF1302 family protein [Holophagaceae bacterium]
MLALPLRAQGAPPEGWAFRGGLTLGSLWRVADRDPVLMGAGNAPVVGATGSGARNQDDGTLNFAKGDVVSSAVHGWLETAYRRGAWRLTVQGKAWHDRELESGARPFGNQANGYAPGRPLSDRGYSPRSAFSGGILQEATLRWTGEALGRPLTLSGGNQLLPWGGGFLSGGGLALLNPVDQPALHRAGPAPEETRVPFPALLGRLELSRDLALEAFGQLGWRPTELDGGGTFYSTFDYVGGGGDRVLVGAGTDAQLLAAGSFLSRKATPDVPAGGQFGAGLLWSRPGWSLGFYAARFHARTPVASAVKTRRTTDPAFIPGDPGGLNGGYLLEYPTGLHLYALRATVDLGPSRLTGEVSHRPDAPIQLYPTDLLNAAVSNTAPTELRADMEALPYGAVLHGSDALRTTQATLALTRPWRDVAGFQEVKATVEAGAHWVHGFPDVDRRRYGRIVILPATGDPARDREGFVTASAWGYKLALQARRTGLPRGTVLVASLNLAHDVRGWAPGVLYLQARKTAQLTLRAEFRNRMGVEATYSGVGGRGYNPTRDRDTAGLALSWRP